MLHSFGISQVVFKLRKSGAICQPLWLQESPTWSSYWRTRAARSRAAPSTCCLCRTTRSSSRPGALPSMLISQVLWTLGLTAAGSATPSLPLVTSVGKNFGPQTSVEALPCPPLLEVVIIQSNIIIRCLKIYKYFKIFKNLNIYVS